MSEPLTLNAENGTITLTMRGVTIEVAAHSDIVLVGMNGKKATLKAPVDDGEIVWPLNPPDDNRIWDALFGNAPDRVAAAPQRMGVPQMRRR